MSTHLPPMTTDNLIASCAEAGEAVSTTQLTSWVRAGLIPAHLRRPHGRGRGMGVEWRWEAECLQRALIIARTLKTGDPSHKRAALMLAALGYAPDAERLRSLLLDGLTTFEQILMRRQVYLTADRSPEDKQRSFRRHIRRRLAHLPRPIVDSLAAFDEALHGLSTAHYEMPPLLTLPAMRQRVEQVDGQTLLANYEQAGRLAPGIAAVWDRIITFQTAFLRRVAPSSDAPASALALLTGLPGEAVVGLLRLICTILLTAIPTSDEQTVTAVYERMFRLMSPLVEFAGVPYPIDNVSVNPQDEGQKGE